MNQTRTTTLRRHPLARRLRRVLHLHHAALVLVALVAASCADDPFDGRQPDDATDPDVLTFAVAPRPAFTEVPTTRGTDTAAPATRAELADDATRWEQGDILWLSVVVYQDKQNPAATRDTAYTSALKYDVDKWRYLTVAEAEDLNTGNLPGFSRLVRWPRGWKDWVDPGMQIDAYYAGSGTPGADGTITITPTGEIPATPVIAGMSGMCSPDGKPVPLELTYGCSRIRIPTGYKVKLTDAIFYPTINFFLNNSISMMPVWLNEIPAQSEDTDVFLSLFGNSTAKLTRDGVSPCTFTFPTITDAKGYPTRFGASYTLTPYTSGTETLVADYDLTIADEAGLRAFAQAVNAGDSLPNGKPAAKARVLQTADITLTAEWVPIGYAKGFRGAYNGNGHTITGLTITTPPADADGYIFAGLFGQADEAVLTGINLRAVEINIRAGSSTPELYAGSIVGSLHNSTLSLCSADGTVNADGGAESVSAGGIAGMINAVAEGAVTISRCRADAGITAATTHADGFASAGGIAGDNFGPGFILCCETGSKPVTAGASQIARAGGITGRNWSSSLIAFCRTGTNAVTAQNGTDVNLAGGLVGQNVGYLYSCYSRAEATAAGSGNKQAGAIVGAKSDTPDSEQHCYGAGATDQGSSDLATGIGIVYKAIPDPGEIFGVMTNYPGEVESLIFGGKTCYPFTTSYDPSATPAYGIIPQRAVWKSDGAWNIGDGTYPKLNIEEYEGK